MRFALVSVVSLVSAAASAQDMPADQAALRDAIASAREAYDGAANDLARGGERPKRGKAICEAVTDRKVNDWVGTVYDLSTNGDGWGVFSVELEGDIWVSTWNNAFSDSDHKTLIDPSSELFTVLTGLSEGQQVSFSGSFFQDRVDGDCVDEKRLTMDGSMDQPEFIFRFSAVAPLP